MTCPELIAERMLTKNALDRVEKLETAIRETIMIADITWDRLDELEVAPGQEEMKEVLLCMVTQGDLKEIVGWDENALATAATAREEG